MTVFRYATPATYWLLIVRWCFILGFYLHRLWASTAENRLVLILLVVLAIDAFRTLFERLFFGAWYTSLAGFLPQAVHDHLVQSHIVFVPKAFNAVAGPHVSR